MILGKPLLGFDVHGEVFEQDKLIHRRINDDYKPEMAEIYRVYREHDLGSKGIIDTSLREDGDLEHRKLAVSYPYEWPANMYKDAVLYHLRLNKELGRVGLTLKDALPNNILFESTTPVFVDFLSLVRTQALRHEDWLEPDKYVDPRFAVIDRMLLPYMALPVIFMARREYQIARDLLSWRSCNCDGAPPSWRELLRLNRRAGKRWILEYLQSLMIAAKVYPLRKSLGRKEPDAFDRVTQRIASTVEQLDVTPLASAYSAYYDEKKEAQSLREPSNFLPKQRTVFQILQKHRPASLLDIGANTGWYSQLAANNGATVIAIEEDESCIDILYRRARASSAKILPLKLSFSDLNKEIYAASKLASDGSALGIEENPLYRSATVRLQAEMVMALGLIHHLVLGEGESLGNAMSALAKLAQKTFVLEFVSLNDEKIVNQPSFFRNLTKSDSKSYNIDKAIESGLRHFASFSLLDSHPETRKILVFQR